jgi:hypothetical protein
MKNFDSSDRVNFFTGARQMFLLFRLGLAALLVCIGIVNSQPVKVRSFQFSWAFCRYVRLG